jgi:hypothetical protein
MDGQHKDGYRERRRRGLQGCASGCPTAAAQRGSERGRIIRQISQSNETKRRRINQIIYYAFL